MDLSSVYSISMLIMNIQDVMPSIMEKYGVFVYLFIFVVIFCETGLVFFPFLPGDSFLFLLGLLSSGGGMNIIFLLIVVSFAAILGDSVNYKIGESLGTRMLQKRWVNKKHVTATQIYYNKYGGNTIILARFVPYIRSFAPFVAGTVRMHYTKFIKYNIIGGVLWTTVFVIFGYSVGVSSLFREQQDTLLLIIIIVSVIMLFSMIINFMRNLKECNVE
jgi:membrane-associated protein